MTDSEQILAAITKMDTKLSAINAQIETMNSRLDKIETSTKLHKSLLASLTSNVGMTLQNTTSPTTPDKNKKSTNKKRKDDYYVLIGKETPCHAAYTKETWITTDYETFVRDGTVTFTPENSDERQAQIAGWGKHLEFRWIDDTHFQVRKKSRFIPGNTIVDCITNRAIYLQDIIYEHEYTYEELCLTVRHFPSTKPDYINLDIVRIQQYVDVEELDNGNYIVHRDKQEEETIEDEPSGQSYRNKYGFNF